MLRRLVRRLLAPRADARATPGEAGPSVAAVPASGRPPWEAGPSVAAVPASGRTPREAGPSVAAVPASGRAPAVPASGRAATPPNPPRALPPAPPGVPDPRARGAVVLVDVPELLAGVQPRGRPVLVHHWASWDELSTAGLPALVALAGPLDRAGVGLVGVAWDEFVSPPLGRIAPMAQRPARWAGGAQVEAWVRQVGVPWPVLVFGAEPDALFDALGLGDRFVPQATLYGPDGAVLAHHGGPFSGAAWEVFAGAALRRGDG